MTPAAVAGGPTKLGFKMLEVQDHIFDQLEKQVTLTGGAVNSPGRTVYDDLSASTTDLRRMRLQPQSTVCALTPQS